MNKNTDSRHTARVQIAALSLIEWTLGKVTDSPCLPFFICKMWIITVPSLQSCCRVQNFKCFFFFSFQHFKYFHSRSSYWGLERQSGTTVLHWGSFESFLFDYLYPPNLRLRNRSPSIQLMLTELLIPVDMDNGFGIVSLTPWTLPDHSASVCFLLLLVT